MAAIVTALSEYPEFVPVVARWNWQEWGHTDLGGTLEGWTAGMARQAGADQIPGTLVAVADGVPVGAVCLVAQDMPGAAAADGLSPWVKALYVVPHARRRGYGTLLMSRCQAWASGLGHRALYLYTERGSGAERLYEGLGWQAIGRADYDGIDATIMSHQLLSPFGRLSPNLGKGNRILRKH